MILIKKSDFEEALIKILSKDRKRVTKTTLSKFASNTNILLRTIEILTV